jgi:hypothetical protein
MLIKLTPELHIHIVQKTPLWPAENLKLILRAIIKSGKLEDYFMQILTILNHLKKLFFSSISLYCIMLIKNYGKMVAFFPPTVKLGYNRHLGTGQICSF